MSKTTYHWSDGWSFSRLPDGSVKVIVIGEDGQLLAKTVIPGDQWASLVSFLFNRDEVRRGR